MVVRVTKKVEFNTNLMHAFSEPEYAAINSSPLDDFTLVTNKHPSACVMKGFVGSLRDNWMCDVLDFALII